MPYTFVWYCPNCSSIRPAGSIDAKPPRKFCCPESDYGMVETRIAEQAKIGFQVIDNIERAIEPFGYRVAKR